MPAFTATTVKKLLAEKLVSLTSETDEFDHPSLIPEIEAICLTFKYLSEKTLRDLATEHFGVSYVTDSDEEGNTIEKVCVTFGDGLQSKDGYIPNFQRRCADVLISNGRQFGYSRKADTDNASHSMTTRSNSYSLLSLAVQPKVWKAFGIKNPFKFAHDYLSNTFGVFIKCEFDEMDEVNDDESDGGDVVGTPGKYTVTYSWKGFKCQKHRFIKNYVPAKSDTEETHAKTMKVEKPTVAQQPQMSPELLMQMMQSVPLEKLTPETVAKLMVLSQQAFAKSDTESKPETKTKTQLKFKAKTQTKSESQTQDKSGTDAIDDSVNDLIDLDESE